ncbi:hypothetical protein AGLY_000744 [Aphis glycines]|uniref:Uncharacterized protein n=1 Tax=Aphis glycines TaxID=307491 RepID=A0A6G0U7V2_APHGL|nr:hypothetical protein AGLY_000744 [Aphis glycines]
MYRKYQFKQLVHVSINRYFTSEFWISHNILKIEPHIDNANNISKHLVKISIYSLCHRKPPLKFEIEALFRQVMLYNVGVAGDLNTLENDIESMKRSTKRLVKNAEILKVNGGKKVLEILESETRKLKCKVKIQKNKGNNWNSNPRARPKNNYKDNLLMLYILVIVVGDILEEKTSRFDPVSPSTCIITL